MLDEVVVAILRGAGWYPGREIDIAPLVVELEDDDCYVSDFASAFLREFGLLTLRVRLPLISKQRRLEIDPRRTTGFDPVDISRRLSSPVCPIAIDDWEHSTLFMDERGYVYNDHDSEVCLMGTSGIDAILAWCLRREFGPSLP